MVRFQPARDACRQAAAAGFDEIFFIGAEFTGAWAKHRGKGITPLSYAARVVASERHTIGEDMAE